MNVVSRSGQTSWHPLLNLLLLNLTRSVNSKAATETYLNFSDQGM